MARPFRNLNPKPPRVTRSNKAAAEVKAAAEQSEAARVTAAGESNIHREPVEDLKGFRDGTYVETGTGEEFKLKIVEDDPHEHKYHLKNEVHFHALSEKDFKLKFEKK